MKRILVLATLVMCLVGCQPENIISGYSQAKLDDLLIQTDLSDKGGYGTCKMYVPKEENITGKLPFVIYFDSNENLSGLGPLIEYVDKEDNPAIVMVVPYGSNVVERSKINHGVETYLMSLAIDSTSAVDPSRIYVTGFGNGAYEAWKFSMETPDIISTVAPVCGGPVSGTAYEEPEVPIVMTDMNIWAVHYVDDPIINNEYSKKIVTAVWTQNIALARFTEFFEGGHTPDIFHNRNFLDWMFGTKRSN